MTIHKLKILPEYFKAVQEGNKTFELRKNDRDYKVGDKIILQEYEPFKDGVIKGEYGLYTGQEIEKEISYILTGGKYGLEEGYCILGLKDIEEHRLYKYLEVLPQGIILKNIDLTGIPILDQIDKVKEEDTEFMIAIELSDQENAIEEFFDKIQSSLGLLEKRFGIKADTVMREYDKHISKIADRPRKKKCSKCVNCEIIKYTNLKEHNLICHQANIKISNETYAKECKSYEEQELKNNG